MTTLEFRLPDIGEGLAEAEVVSWLVAVGDRVRPDQPVVTVETAKAQVDLPAPAAGVVRSLAAEVADVVPVGAPLFVLDTETAGPAGGRRVLAAPSVRKLAVELDVDLARLTGSGPGGRVTLDDVRGAVSTADTEDTVDTEDSGGRDIRPLKGIRRQVAAAMTAAWTVPHITEFRELDATEFERAHRTLRSTVDGEIRLTLLPLLVRAVVVALRRHPLLNATLDATAERFEVHHTRRIGIATATEHGLVVPILHDADRLAITATAAEIARLSQAARARALSIADTTGGTFTISNFGSYGTWLGTPLINAPQVAIAGFGRVRDAVVAVDGVPAVRRVLPVAVSADHRLIDGDQLGAFVNTLARVIAAPLLLLGED